MELQQAAALIQTLAQPFPELADWNFSYDNAKRRLGCTKFRTKTISLSAPCTKIAPEAQVRNTILHEIAHALVGPHHGHDEVWRQKALSIGCDGQRCSLVTQSVPHKYTLKCTHCNELVGHYYRLPTRKLDNCWHQKCGRAARGKIQVESNGVVIRYANMISES